MKYRRGFSACLTILLVSCSCGSAALAQQPASWPASSTLYQRWRAWYAPRAYPLGYIPTGARESAAQQMAAMGSGAQAGSAWINIGPAPITTSNEFNLSGRITAIAVDPVDATHWIVGTPGGGIWGSYDSGSTWTALTDELDSLAIGAIAFGPGIHPVSQGIAYAGTGEVNDDASLGIGFLKSTDSGFTWQLIASAPFVGLQFSDIEVDPNNENTVVAATSGGLFRSTDGGLTWSQPLPGFVPVLKVDPTNFSRQYSAIANSDLFGSVYRSTNGGQTWRAVQGPWLSSPPNSAARVGVAALAIGPSDPGVLYVGIADRNPVPPAPPGSLLGLWRTGNAWDAIATWMPIPLPTQDQAGNPVTDYCEPQCFYDNVLSVDPNNPDALYAGGVELWKYVPTQNPPWTVLSRPLINGTLTELVHVDQHRLVWVENRLIVGSDGGVWSTADGGGSWTDHNTILSITQLNHGSLHPLQEGNALGGAQDNGSSQWRGGFAWQHVLGGDGQTTLFTSGSFPFAVSQPKLFILRRFQNFSCTTNPDPDNAPYDGRFVKCPGNDDVVIAGSTDLLETGNFLSTACTGSDVVWQPRCPGTTGGIPISALGFGPPLDPTLPCNVFALGAVANGTLRLTTDGGNSCCDLNLNPDSTKRVPDGSVSALVFNPKNRNTVYVTLAGSAGGHVFTTSNALAPQGQTAWSDITPKANGVPVNLPFNTVTVDPVAPNIVYVGTDMGVMKSPDCGATWTPLATGLPKVQVNDLQISAAGKNLIAFTFGRGAFRLSIHQCSAGDCDDDGVVTVSEIVLMVNIALDSAPLSGCSGCDLGDVNGDGFITVNEIIAGVNKALSDCASGAPSAAATASAVTLQIGSTCGAQGSTVTIPVSISGGAGTIAGAELDIVFDAAVLSNPTCSKDARLTSQTLYWSLPASPPTPAGKQRLRLLVLDPDNASAFDDGPLLTCTFSMNPGAPNDPFPLNGERLYVSDGAGNSLPAAVTNGCDSGSLIDNASLRVSKNLNPAGDETLRLKGEWQLASLAPLIDPVANGFAFSIEDQNGVAIFSRLVPGGTPTFLGAPGWTVNRTATKWTFTDHDGTLAGGITKVTIWDKSNNAPGLFRFKVTGKENDFQVRVDRLPVHEVVVLGGSAQVCAGQCATLGFNAASGPPPNCRSSGGSTVKCG